MAEFNTFSEDELEHLIRVEACDQELRHKTYSQLRSKESRLNELIARRENFVRAPNFAGKNCVLCYASFSLFNWSKECSSCKNQICGECVAKNQTSGIVCVICDERRDVKLRQKEWALMCPYAAFSFGIVKLFTPTLPNDNGIQYPWFQRTRIEMKLQNNTKLVFDDQSVNEKSYVEQIENSRRNLERTITGIFQQHPPINDTVLTKNLENSVKEIKAILIDAKRDGTSLSLSSHPIPRTYEALLSTAVVNKMTISCVNWSVERVASIATQTDDEMESPNSDRDTITTLPGPQHAQNHKVPLPSLDVDTDIDSALDTDEVDLDSISSWGPNWFLKGKLPISPRGSIRSQCSSRLPPSNFSSLLLAFEENQRANEFSGSGDEASGEEEDSVNATAQEGEAPTFVEEPKSLRCESGEFVEFNCEIVGTEPIDVYWYNSSKEIADQGRFRIINRGTKHTLQIFDAEPKDSGEIVCLAVNEISVTSVIATLHIKDADLAGEEPGFLEELNSLVAKEGDTAELSCRVSGYPICRVIFHRNNVPIHDDDRRLTESEDNGIWILKISSVKVDDSAQYTAVAVNRMGRAVSRGALSVFPSNPSSNNSPRYIKNNRSSIDHGKSKIQSEPFSKNARKSPGDASGSDTSRQRNFSAASSTTSC